MYFSFPIKNIRFYFREYIRWNPLLVHSNIKDSMGNVNQTVYTDMPEVEVDTEEPLWDSGEVEWEVFENDKNRTVINNMFW
jgi:hypothetical protein